MNHPTIAAFFDKVRSDAGLAAEVATLATEWRNRYATRVAEMAQALGFTFTTEEFLAHLASAAPLEQIAAPQLETVAGGAAQIGWSKEATDDLDSAADVPTPTRA